MWHSLLRLIWFSFAGLVVSIAVAMSAARILLPQMSAYRAELESVSANYLQRPVQIGALDAAWRGLSPVLRLQQLAIEDERLPGGRLDIREVRVEFDILESLQHLQWRMAGIELIGLESRVEVGKRPLPPLSALLAPFKWLLQQGNIVLREVHFDILDSRFGRQPLQFELVRLRLANTGRRHQLLVETSMPDSMGGSLKLAADFTGEVDQPETWKGRSYLGGTALSLDTLQPWLVNFPMMFSGQMDAELWLDIDNGKFDQASGSLVVQDFLFAAGDADPEQVTGSFRVSRSDDEWQLTLSDFEVERDGIAVWPASNGQLTIFRGETTFLRGSVSHIALEEVERVLPLLPWIDVGSREMLDDLNVSGGLDDVDFDVELVPERAPRFSVRARFNSLSVESSAELPAIRNLSGSMEGNLQSGFIKLDGAHSVLSMPGVFPHELQLDALSGTVHWQRYQDMFRIESTRLELASGPLRASARARLDWPYSQAPWLDLRIALEDFPLEQVKHYLPEKVLRPRAVAWLRNAFTAGTARNTRFLLQGQLDEVPFDQFNGRLEARFDFDGVGLDYHPQWERLDGLSGSALFVGRSMTIIGDHARIQDSHLEQVVADIRDFKHPLLKMQGTVGGTLSGMLDYVEISPLGKRFGKLLSNLEAEGDASLQLKLGIPLAKDLGKLAISGDVTLEGNALRSEYTDLPLDDLHGILHFTTEGISADKVKASLLGQPVLVSVYRQGEADRSKTVVDVRGKLKLVQALKKSASPFGASVDGEADWITRLLIQNRPRRGEPGVVLQLGSDLVGVSSRLPAPFDKPAQEARQLQIEWVPGTESPFVVTYADHASARMLLNRDWSSVRRLAVRFGGQAAVLQDRDQIYISGNLETLDVPAWIAMFAQRSAGGRAVPPLAVDLDIGSLQLFGHAVQNVVVLSRPQDPWYFLMKSEQAEGWVRWVPGGVIRPARLLANLDVLVLETLPVAGDAGSRSVLHPRDIPELDLRVGDLDWGGRKLGGVRVSSKRIEDGADFEVLEIDSEAVLFTGSGAWKEHGGQQSSQFSATVTGGNLGKLLKWFGDQDSIQDGAIQEGNVQLNWQGSPVEFSLKSVEGEISLKATDGRLNTVKEGAGKLLHVISLNSLQRRLSLDFSDLFKEGFTFDKLRGNFVLADGNAYTDRFTIKGPSAIVEISGRTGLVARDYDQQVTVTPQVSSSLPIAGVIAGGPVVGAAVLLVERLMGQEFNRMVQVKYQVTGSWDKPVYTRLVRENVPSEDDSGLHPGDF